MKNVFSPLKSMLAIAVLAIVLFSCGKKAPEQVKHIPKDANIVLTVDVKSIALKAFDFKDLFSQKEKDSLVQKFLESGIDKLTTAYFFGSASDKEIKYYSGLVALSDEAKFETFVKGLDKKYVVSSEGELKFATSETDKNEVIAWNKETAIFFEQSDVSKDNAKERVKAFFALKKEESLAENDKNFGEIQKKPSDISLWVNVEPFTGFLANIDPSVNAKETYFNALCSFENGQIVVDSKTYMNKGLAEAWNFGKEANINKDIVNGVPGKSVLGMYGLSLDIPKIFKALDKQNATAGLDQNLAMFGLSKQDLISMLTGDMVATFNGVTMKDGKRYNFETEQEETVKQPYFEFSVLIGVKDKSVSAKLISTLEKNRMLTKKDGYFATPDDSYVLIDKGSYLILASNSLKDFAISGSGDKLKSELSTLVSDNSTSMYLDVAGIVTSLPEDWTKELGVNTKKHLSNLEAITVSGSQKDVVADGKFVLSFKNKDQNSFVTVAKMGNEIGEEVQQQMAPKQQPIIMEETAPIEEKVPADPMEIQ